MPRPAKEVDTSTFAGKIGAEIRRRREKLYDTAESAANKAGVTVPRWYRWETGQITIQALPIAAKSLKCSPRDLVPRA